MFFIISFLFFCTPSVFSQPVAIGGWKIHLPYNNCQKVVIVDSKIYCSTIYGMFVYNKVDGTMKRLSKIDGFSDVKIKTMGYSKENNTLVIVYENANIDIIKNNTLYNFMEIKRSSINTLKQINHLLFNKDRVYFSANFGIVIVNLNTFEVVDTYSNLGLNGDPVEINATAILNDSLFAATNKGLFVADLNSTNLHDYHQWQQQYIGNLSPSKEIFNMTVFSDKLYVNADSQLFVKSNRWSNAGITGFTKDMTVSNETLLMPVQKIGQYTYLAVIEKDGTFHKIQNQNISAPQSAEKDITDNTYWIADYWYGLVRLNSKDSSYTRFYPNGPDFTLYSHLYAFEDEIYALHNYGISLYKNNEWSLLRYKFENNVLSEFGITQPLPGAKIFTGYSAIQKRQSDQKLFIGLWGDGLLEIGDSSKWYNVSNSIIASTLGDNFPVISSLNLDARENLFIHNLHTNNPILIKTVENKWQGLFVSSSSWRAYSQMIIDNTGQIWAPVFEGVGGGGIIVYNHNNTLDNLSDDKYTQLTTETGKGELPNANIHAITNDLNGEIWVGSDDGVTVFYNPEFVFRDLDFDAKCPILLQRCLLTDQEVNVITVDAANRKWVGTNGGVWLFNADGTEPLLHFTKENSPLISDKVISIVVNNLNGEVFFATDQGIISYRSTATKADSKHSDIMIFPNPVEPTYSGLIIIQGLANNANVKITDISGRLVFETKATGGTATWNGNDINGVRVNTGIYLVFSHNEDGTETMVNKLAFIR